MTAELPQRQKPTIYIVGVALLSLALSLVAVAVAQRQPGTSTVRSIQPRTGTSTVPQPPQGATFAARSTPTWLRIPALSVSARVIRLGLNQDGTVQVPASVSVTGWYKLGPSPGQNGSAVILGHVDSYRGPGVFFNLRKLASGDRLLVTLANGRVEHFVVTSVHMYLKSKFPRHLVYGSHGRSELQLATCGGKFNSATGSYESNIVVYSSRVK